MAFQKAVKSQRPLKLALFGPSGGGKTYTALRIAENFTNGGRVVVIDTERGSASLYSDEFDFDTAALTHYGVDDYVALIKEADNAGYDVIIIDSISHAWEGKGGIMDAVEGIKKQKGYRDSFRAWADVKPIENRLWDALLDAQASVIVTMRAKTSYEVGKDDKGKLTIEKLGLAPIQRSDKEYEFDVVGRMDNAELVIVKSRCKALAENPVYHHPGKDVADILRTWLATGAAAMPKQQGVEAPTDAATTTAERKRQLIILCERIGAPKATVVDYLEHHTGHSKYDELDEETQEAILMDWGEKAEIVQRCKDGGINHVTIFTAALEAEPVLGYKNIHVATNNEWRRWLDEAKEQVNAEG